MTMMAQRVTVIMAVMLYSLKTIWSLRTPLPLSGMRTRHGSAVVRMNVDTNEFYDENNNFESSSSFSFFPFSNDVVAKNKRGVKDFALPAAIVSSLVLLPFDNEAFAAASDYGILAGRSASMAHPVTMFLLLATSLYTGYLGLQFRRLRGISDEIKDLQSQLPTLSSGKRAVFPVQSLIDDLNNEWVTLNDEARKEGVRRDLNALRDAVIVDSKIGELQNVRKQLQGDNLRDKHFTSGSWLLGVGVTVSLLGAFNTYMRAGKLFPGPHLYAGMAITIMWALAAALVPAMQKGSEPARVAHIALNGGNVLLFFWQVASGVDIMVKVWEKTSWP